METKRNTAFILKESMLTLIISIIATAVGVGVSVSLYLLFPSPVMVDIAVFAGVVVSAALTLLFVEIRKGLEQKKIDLALERFKAENPKFYQGMEDHLNELLDEHFGNDSRNDKG